jgi:hypothetical protein
MLPFPCHVQVKTAVMVHKHTFDVTEVISKRSTQPTNLAGLTIKSANHITATAKQGAQPCHAFFKQLML